MGIAPVSYANTNCWAAGCAKRREHPFGIPPGSFLPALYFKFHRLVLVVLLSNVDQLPEESCIRWLTYSKSISTSFSLQPLTVGSHLPPSLPPSKGMKSLRGPSKLGRGPALLHRGKALAKILAATWYRHSWNCQIQPFFSQISKKPMEKPCRFGKLPVIRIIVVFLGTVAFSCSLAAEFKKAKVNDESCRRCLSNPSVWVAARLKAFTFFFFHYYFFLSFRQRIWNWTEASVRCRGALRSDWGSLQRSASR